MRRHSMLRVGSFVAAILLLSLPSAFAADSGKYELIVKNHKFHPATLTLPAGKRIKLTVKNQDPTPMEFESYELGREKVIVGNFTATIYLGPLEPGTYKFFDDFHRSTTKGVIKVGAKQ